MSMAMLAVSAFVSLARRCLARCSAWFFLRDVPAELVVEPFARVPHAHDANTSLYDLDFLKCVHPKDREKILEADRTARSTSSSMDLSSSQPVRADCPAPRT
jgi:hypothetical protein